MTYTYNCDEHGEIEVNRSIKEDDLSFINCPVCGKKIFRSYSKVAIHFNAAGFYVTDSHSKNSASS